MIVSDAQTNPSLVKSDREPHLTNFAQVNKRAATFLSSLVKTGKQFVSGVKSAFEEVSSLPSLLATSNRLTQFGLYGLVAASSFLLNTTAESSEMQEPNVEARSLDRDIDKPTFPLIESGGLIANNPVHPIITPVGNLIATPGFYYHQSGYVEIKKIHYVRAFAVPPGGQGLNVDNHQMVGHIWLAEGPQAFDNNPHDATPGVGSPIYKLVFQNLDKGDSVQFAALRLPNPSKQVLRDGEPVLPGEQAGPFAQPFGFFRGTLDFTTARVFEVDTGREVDLDVLLKKGNFAFTFGAEHDANIDGSQSLASIEISGFENPNNYRPFQVSIAGITEEAGPFAFPRGLFNGQDPSDDLSGFFAVQLEVSRNGEMLTEEVVNQVASSGAFNISSQDVNGDSEQLTFTLDSNALEDPGITCKATVLVQSSSDLENWQVEGPLVDNGTGLMSYTTNTREPRKFYRLAVETAQ